MTSEEMERFIEAMRESGPFTKDLDKDKAILQPVADWLTSTPGQMPSKLRILLNLVHDNGILRGQTMTAFHIAKAQTGVMERIQKRSEAMTV